MGSQPLPLPLAISNYKTMLIEWYFTLSLSLFLSLSLYLSVCVCEDIQHVKTSIQTLPLPFIFSYSVSFLETSHCRDFVYVDRSIQDSSIFKMEEKEESIYCPLSSSSLSPLRKHSFTF